MNNQNRYDEAIKYYEDYVALSPTLGVYRNYQLESEVYRKLAHAYSTKGKYKTSLDYLQKALKLDQEVNKEELKIIEDLRLLGTVKTYLGEYSEATGFLNQSLERTDGMESSVKESRRMTVADTHLSLAHVETVLGNFENALNHVETALSIYERLPNENVGKIEANLLKGNILIAQNYIDEGLNYIEISTGLAKTERLNVSRQLQSRGEAFKLKGELENSLKAKLGSLEEARSSNITPQIIWATLRVGDGYRDLGDVERANQYYLEGLNLQNQSAVDTSGLLPSLQMRMGEIEQARSFWSRSGSKLGSAIANLKLGESQLAEGNIEESFQYFDEASTLFTEIGSDEGLAKANIGLSHSLINQGDVNQALKILNEALDISLQPDTHWQVWFQKGSTFENSNNQDSSINAYLKSIEIIEQIRGSLTIEEFRSSYFQDKTIVYDRLINVLFKKGGSFNYLDDEFPASHLAFIINEKARSRTFLDIIGNKKLNPKSSEDAPYMEDEQALRLKMQQLSRQVQRSNLNRQDLSNLKSALDQSQEDYQLLVEKIKLLNTAYQSLVSIEPPPLNKIQSTLGNKTALIEYWVGNDSITAWVIGQSKLMPVRLTITKDQLIRNVAALRNAIQFRMQDNMEKILSLLYDELIYPLDDAIRDYDNIGIIPHGPLHFLPFQALIDVNDGAYFVSKKNIFYSPSAAVYYYTHLKTETKANNVLSLALGNHKIGEHNALPGTEYEVNQIGQFYNQYTPRYRENNSETYFKSDAENFSVIHIATHGILSDNQPLYSYLLMSPSETDDGRLTVEEIMDLNLSSKLVTLSACETALGDLNSGDELVGLSRAFLYAGTSSVIVSLWTVDDISTSILMTKFHQFLNEGNRPAIALSMAQREMLKTEFQLSDGRGRALEWDSSIQKVVSEKNKFNKSPYYWAPFILIGDIF